MQRILNGLDYVSNRNHVLREIAQYADAGVENLLLIVPENQTHEAERRLCEVGGNRISRFAQVVTFQRLATRIFSKVGGDASVALDRGGKLLTMSKTCRHLSSNLKVFRSQSNSTEYLLSLVDLCDELESSCITSVDLNKAASKFEGVFAEKLEELSMIQDAFFTNCREHKSVLSRLGALLANARELVANMHIWIDGFTYMTRQEREIACKLADSAADFTLVLTGDMYSEKDRVFGALRDYANDFLCKGYDTQYIPPEPERRDPTLKYVSENLFGARPEPWQGDCEPIKLLCAPSVSEECLACADAVMKLIRSGKARFGEINVVYTDASRYQSALYSVFSRFGIPAYYSGSEPIENQSIAAFVLTALEAVSGGMEYEDVLRHLKTGLCAIDSSDCDLLENYAYTWSVRGKRWFSEWTLHPDGFGGKETEQSVLALRQLNELRERAMRPLQQLYRGIRDSQKVRDQILALYSYFDQVGLCHTLEMRAKQLEGSQQAMELAQLYEIVCSALEQMNEILGEDLCSSEEFTRLVRLLLTQYQVSTITPYLDHVQVGSAENLYRAPCRYLFVLGAEEGQLPSNLSPRG